MDRAPVESLDDRKFKKWCRLQTFMYNDKQFKGTLRYPLPHSLRDSSRAYMRAHCAVGDSVLINPDLDNSLPFVRVALPFPCWAVPAGCSVGSDAPHSACSDWQDKGGPAGPN